MVLVGAPWWTRPGLAPRDGRLTIAGEDAETPRAKPRDAALRLRPRPLRRQRRRLAAALDAHRAGRPAPLRAQGQPGAAGPRGPPAARRDRRLLARRGRARDRVRLAGRGDQLHRHEPVRARPRRDPAAADPPQPRRGQPGRAGRPAGAAARAIGLRINPGAGAGLSRGPRLQRRPPDEVRHLRGPPRPTRSTAARRHGLTIDTIHFHAGSGWLVATGWPASRRRSRGSRRSPAA